MNARTESKNAPATREPLSVHEYAVAASFLFALIALPLVILDWYQQSAVIGIVGVILALGAYGVATRRLRVAQTLWLSLALTVLFSGGVMLLRGFFTGDGFAYWLPLARTLVEQGGLPAMTPTPIGYTSREPLYPLILSLGLFFSRRVLAYAWVGPVFTALTLTILLRWARELRLPATYRRWLVILFFASPLVLFWSWNLLQESMILFYFTAFFYHADKFRKAGNTKDRTLALAAAGLAAITKFVGILLIVPAIILLLRRSGKDSWLPRLGILCAAYLPAGLWFVRNAVLYGSPVFPIFGSLFPTIYGHYVQFDQFLGSRDFTLMDKIVFSLRSVTFQLPLIFAGILGLLRYRRFAYLASLLLFAAAATTVLFSQTSVTRYYYPFAGLLLVFGLRYVSQTRSRVASMALLAVSLWSLFSLAVTMSTSSFIGRLESLFVHFVPVINFFARFSVPLSILLAMALVLRSKRREVFRHLLLASFALGALHLRFIENKSWLATWPWVLLFIAAVLWIIWRSQKANTSATALQGYSLAVVLIVTWGMGLTFGIVNRDMSFNSVSRIYYGHERIADFIDGRENGGRNFFILAEDAPYYVWNRRLPVLSFRSYNFNYQTAGSYLKASNPRELHDALMHANIRYIVDQGDEVSDRYVDLPSDFLTSGNMLMTVVRANPDFFAEVFTYDDPERQFTHRVYAL